MAGFTGVSFLENDPSRRELGKFKSYPKGPECIMDDEVLEIYESCEARRIFAKRKKEQLLRRG